MNEPQVVSATRQWVEDVVVGYNLCPFAKRELVKNRVRFVVSEAENEDELLQALQSELQRLEDEPDVETTLLIHPGVLQDFVPQPPPCVKPRNPCVRRSPPCCKMPSAPYL